MEFNRPPYELWASRVDAREEPIHMAALRSLPRVDDYLYESQDHGWWPLGREAVVTRILHEEVQMWRKVEPDWVPIGAGEASNVYEAALNREFPGGRTAPSAEEIAGMEDLEKRCTVTPATLTEEDVLELLGVGGPDETEALKKLDAITARHKKKTEPTSEMLHFMIAFGLEETDPRALGNELGWADIPDRVAIRKLPATYANPIARTIVAWQEDDGRSVATRLEVYFEDSVWVPSLTTDGKPHEVSYIGFGKPEIDSFL